MLQVMEKLPDRYAANREEWQEKLAHLGLGCWTPSESEEDRLDRLGDLDLGHVNATERHPMLSDIMRRVLSEGGCGDGGGIGIRAAAQRVQAPPPMGCPCALLPWDPRNPHSMPSSPSGT